ncbi:MAG: hypothetical protein KGL39_48115 [Patescibacteria group bacterium]|nr:hypothetical protein [Patescibacteria group bacterium]
MKYTVYELRYGSNLTKETRKCFPAHNYNDAVVRFAETVVAMDRISDFWAAWASLEKRDPDGVGTNLASWTKTSNETPTVEGEDF